MNFLSAVRSVTKEDPYLILVRSPLSEKTRTFKVKGHLSINAEKEINSYGEVFQDHSYQFICDTKIEDKLKTKEKKEEAKFYLIDLNGNEVNLVLVNDYSKKGYLLGAFNNYVYRGKITYANN